jgi:DNA-directed RNA polymerase II subunit RPB2
MNEEKIFELLKNFFETNGTAHIQLQSYNDFVTRGIQKIIDEKPEIVINSKKNQKVVFSFSNVFVGNPVTIDEDRVVRKITPAEARTRDLTYQSPVYVDIIEKTFDDENLSSEKIYQRVVIAQIPTMIYSVVCNLYNKSKQDRINAGECRFDQGGYFIINGKERVIVAQQRPNYNFIQVIIQSITSNSKYKYISEIRSVAEESGYSVLVQTMMSVDERTIYTSLPNIKEAIPAGIVFKALGFTEDKDIKEFINNKYDIGHKYVKYIIQDSAHITSREDALLYISKYPMYAIPKEKQEAYARQIIERELFPHLGITSSLRDKASFLGIMINKLIATTIGVRKDDDRDNVSNKRFEGTGALILEIFRGAMDNFLKSVNIQLQKRLDINFAISHCNILTKNIMLCFKTGNWGTKKTGHMKMGVSQILNRMTYGATLSHLRHVVIPIGKEGKNAKIRQIHTSQFGFICPAETPEGATSGIVTNFSILTKISKRVSTIITKEIIEKLNNFLPLYAGDVNITINGILIGSTKEPISFIEEINEKRQEKLIDSEVSAVYLEDEEEIRIYCDEGRLLRPLFVVNNNKIYDGDCTNWEKLVEEGHIRYVDSIEVENSVIAMTKENLNSEYSYDFCEIHPSTLLGVCASIIPFPDHSQSPRNCYQSSMAKQALGIPVETINSRSDTIIYSMDYPQKPLVSTKAAEFMGFNDMPSGANPIVAIMTKEGFNQEDSVILNKSSIERGMFRVTAYFTLSDEETRNNSSNYQTIEIPHPDIRNSKNNYSFLDSKTGIIKKGIQVKKDDVIIGKVLIKIGKDGTEEKKDISVTIKSGEEGTIHDVKITTTVKGYKLVKIMIRVIKTPEVGDKFASRAAQKGTCGMIFGQEDMPFTEDGITPDIIINPHCIPSRMTINQLMECILGKTCAIKGEFGNATPFSSASTNVAEKLCDNLEGCGYERHGLETMYNPYTGERMEAKIFIGPTYYQRLKHMVSDKIHSRAKGHVTMLTRQPLEGRSRDGGLRFGEMERDAMIVHGVSRFLKERLFDMSDPFNVIVCNLCGMISSSKTECKGCKEDKLCYINIPYAAKLLFQELNAMGIKTELIPKKI